MSSRPHASIDNSRSVWQPWPIIAAFLASLPTGFVGVDLGTGNGKYLPLPLERPGNVWTVGLDRSRNLLQIAKHAGEREREVVWGDVLDGPWRAGAFVSTLLISHVPSRVLRLRSHSTFLQDYAISIATIHHLATPERRRAAVKVRKPP